MQSYYEQSRIHLYSIIAHRNCLTCLGKCSDTKRVSLLNNYYVTIVDALTQASQASVPTIRNDVLHQIKISTQLKYKLAIRQAFVDFENRRTDELHLHFLNINLPEFWKVWNKKGNKSVVHHAMFLSMEVHMINKYS